jgi:hypothetical protein
MTPTLVDAVERNRQHPDTFAVPDQAQLPLVAIGDVVKVCLEAPNKEGERFWVLVTENNPLAKTFKGTVDNELVVFDGFPLHMEMEVEYRHVLDWWVMQ